MQNDNEALQGRLTSCKAEISDTKLVSNVFQMFLDKANPGQE